MLIHSSGAKTIPAGRLNEAPSIGLSKSLKEAGFKLGRLQTGTPARLDKRTIDFDKTIELKGDTEPKPFSYMNRTVNNAVSRTYVKRLSMANLCSGRTAKSVAS